MTRRRRKPKPEQPPQPAMHDCPRCNYHQVTYAGKDLDPESGRERYWYECGHCGDRSSIVSPFKA